MANQESEQPTKPADDSGVFHACPHCGAELRPWERVLLSVDRALMCRNCWYRIILDMFESPPTKKPGASTKPEGPEQ